MKYKIPDGEMVTKAISEVLDEHREVFSQDSFHQMVQSKLRMDDKKYRVSAERLRRVASTMKNVGIRVVKMRSRLEPKECFICSGELASFESVDLFGGRTPLGKRCKRCGFEMEKGRLAPRRYVFYRR